MKKYGKKYRKKSIIILIAVIIGYILVCCFVPPLFTEHSENRETVSLTRSKTEKISLVDDNTEALLWRLRMIQEAEKEIILTTFEMRDDVSGRAVMAALLDAADRGVQVRILIDGIDGALRLHSSAAFEALCSCENIQVKYYNPLKLWQLWKVNYRLHDKYLIVDDTAYLLGGRNTHDIYLGDFSDNQQYDREIVVYESGENEVSSLRDLKDYFEITWNLKDCKLLLEEMNTKKYEETRNSMKEHLETVYGYYDGQLEEIKWDRETCQTNGVTLLTGNPQAGNKEPDLWEQMCRLMENAEEDVMIQTPLVNCDKDMLENLRKIREQTRQVEILTNAAHNWVNPLAAGFSYRKQKLLETGVVLSEYYGEEAFHTKTILIDGNISIIGSYNLDPRSTYIDTEIMLVVDCPGLNQTLRNEMEQIVEQSITTTQDGTVNYGKKGTYAEPETGRKFLDVFLGTVLYYFAYLL